MEQYFGHRPQDWERSMIKGKYDGSGRMKEMQRAMANPEQYTTTRPNMTSEAAFTVDTKKGAGKGLQTGNTHAYYKIEKQAETAPAQQASAPEPKAAPEPVKEKGPVEYSPEIASAKERVQKFKGAMDGNAGSTFSTSAPAEPTSQAATASFLDSRKTDYKQAYNFEPKTDITYGAN